MQQVRGAPALLVWDSAYEWHRKCRLERVSNLADLHEHLVAELRGDRGPLRMAWVGAVSKDHFETFCRLAWVWLRASRGVLIVEELADVTSPGKAPAAWGEIVRKHRHSGGQVYALTQRPAESDKTIVGNAAVIHCGRMNRASDRKYMADCLDVSLEEITRLQDLDYLERDMRTHRLERGRVRFK